MNLESMVRISHPQLSTLLLPLRPLPLTRLSVSNDVSKAFLGCTISSLHRTFCAPSKCPYTPIATTAAIFSPQLLAHLFINPYRL